MGGSVAAKLSKNLLASRAFNCQEISLEEGSSERTEQLCPKQDDRTQTDHTNDSSMHADLRNFSLMRGDSTGPLKLEKFCSDYGPERIWEFTNRNRAELKHHSDFFERCIKSVHSATLQPIKLLISIAMLVGNPIFTQIPKIIANSKEEFRPTLVDHLKRASAVNFGPIAAEWLESNYSQIYEDTFTLCRGFELEHISPDYHTHALQIHRHVEVKSVYQFCNLAEVHWRHAHCFDIWERLPPQVRLTQSEYNQFIGSLVDDNRYRQFAEELRSTPVRNWSDKIKQLTSSPQFQDARSRQEHLLQLQLTYGDLPQSKLKTLLGHEKTFEKTFEAAALAPSSKQFAIAQFLAVQKHGRWICQMAPGHGKSRIAAFAALVHLSLQPGCKAFFLFPTKHLRDRDKALYHR